MLNITTLPLEKGKYILLDQTDGTAQQELPYLVLGLVRRGADHRQSPEPFSASRIRKLIGQFFLHGLSLLFNGYAPRLGGFYQATRQREAVTLSK